MLFIFLTFAASLGIETIGTYISVMGLAAVFSANPVIMTMAVILDFAKLVTVAFVYRNWAKVNMLMRAYMTIAAVVLMLITSVGAFGYLSAEFQRALIPNKESQIKIDALTQEQTRLQARKQEIDKQIAQIPANIVRNRIKLIASFKEEGDRVNARLVKIDEELPTLKVKDANVEAHIGPISYVAKAFDVSMEQAVKWVIMLIIFVFDPLAVVLILAGNFLIEQRKNEAKQVEIQAMVAAEMDVQKPKYDLETLIAETPPEYFSEEYGLEAWPAVKAEEIHTAEPVVIPDAQDVREERPQKISEKIEEPNPRIKTDRQLDKLAHVVTPDAIEEMLDELKLDDVFTSSSKDDTITQEQPTITPLKGVMDRAFVGVPGSEIEFFQSPHDSPERQYYIK